MSHVDGEEIDGKCSQIGDDHGLLAVLPMSRTSPQPDDLATLPAVDTLDPNTALSVEPVAPLEVVGRQPNDSALQEIIDTRKAPPELNSSIDQSIRAAFDQPRARLFILRLEQKLVEFVKQASPDVLDLPAANPYERLLTHKLADYFMLDHITDPLQTGVKIYRTPKTQIPLTTITDAVGVTESPGPSVALLKIMRRNASSEVGSDAGDGADLASNLSIKSDESGSSSIQRPLTIEEKTASYEAARARIFADFKEMSIDKKPNAPKDRPRYRNDDFSVRSQYKLVPTSRFPQSTLHHAAYLGPLTTALPPLGRPISVNEAFETGQSAYVGFQPGHFTPQSTASVSSSVNPEPPRHSALPFGYQVPVPRGQAGSMQAQPAISTLQSAHAEDPQVCLPSAQYQMSQMMPYPVNSSPSNFGSAIAYRGSESYIPGPRSYPGGQSYYGLKQQQPYFGPLGQQTVFGYPHGIQGSQNQMSLPMGAEGGQFSNQKASNQAFQQQSMFVTPQPHLHMPHKHNNLPKPVIMPLPHGAFVSPKIPFNTPANNAFAVKAPVGVEVDGVIYYDRNQQRLFEATFGPSASTGLVPKQTT